MSVSRLPKARQRVDPLRGREAWSSPSRAARRRNPRLGQARTEARRPGRPVPIRLRYVLLVGLGVALVASLIPRAAAYWRLHTSAAALANYALCMAGPTGPTLFQSQPDEFWDLVRRRLVSAGADSQPFESCVEPLAEVTSSEALLTAHQARARDFQEYSAFDGPEITAHTLASLHIDTSPLEQLEQASYPFSQGGYERLLRPSRNSRTVAHPLPLPAPSQGTGLPRQRFGYTAVLDDEAGHTLLSGQGANLQAYSSTDGGRAWMPAHLESPDVRELAGRCAVGREAPAFRLGADAHRLRIESWLNQELQTSFPLSDADHVLLQLSCDRSAAVAVVRGQGAQDLSLMLCPHRARCRELMLPESLLRGVGEGASFSVARVRGVTVVSLARGDVVRVVSSRDDGHTWAPPTVAYDRREARGSAVLPDRLLSLGRRVILYAGSERPGSAYPVLASDDYGASWSASFE